MKRLFVVRHKDGWMDTDSNTPYHPNKKSAKVHRDRLNSGLKTPVYKVSPGPDHRRYQG